MTLYMYCLVPNRFLFLWNKMLLMLHLEFMILLGASGYSGSTFSWIKTFSFVMHNNFMELIPYIFTSCSHMSMTLTLALPLWLSFMLYGWINHTNHMFAHLMLLGTPSVLMPFMECIATDSNFICPGTLAVRLAANMIAEHFSLTILGSTGPYLYIILNNSSMINKFALLFFESVVSVIQSYVFALLSNLYSTEVS